MAIAFQILSGSRDKAGDEIQIGIEYDDVTLEFLGVAERGKAKISSRTSLRLDGYPIEVKNTDGEKDPNGDSRRIIDASGKGLFMQKVEVIPSGNPSDPPTPLGTFKVIPPIEFGAFSCGSNPK